MQLAGKPDISMVSSVSAPCAPSNMMESSEHKLRKSFMKCTIKLRHFQTLRDYIYLELLRHVSHEEGMFNRQRDM